MHESWAFCVEGPRVGLVHASWGIEWPQAVLVDPRREGEQASEAHRAVVAVAASRLGLPTGLPLAATGGSAACSGGTGGPHSVFVAASSWSVVPTPRAWYTRPAHGAAGGAREPPALGTAGGRRSALSLEGRLAGSSVGLSAVQTAASARWGRALGIGDVAACARQAGGQSGDVAALALPVAE